MDFAVPVDYRIKLKESEKMDEYLDLARELKKLWNMKVSIVPIVIGSFDTVPGGFGSWLTSGNHPNNSIIEDGENTAKSPGDLRRLAVTQIPVTKPSAYADVKNSKRVSNKTDHLISTRPSNSNKKKPAE